MIKLEYKVEEINIRSLESELNKLGDSGWELSSLYEITATIVRVVLKRPQVAGTIQLLG